MFGEAKWPSVEAKTSVNIYIKPNPAILPGDVSQIFALFKDTWGHWGNIELIQVPSEPVAGIVFDFESYRTPTDVIPFCARITEFTDANNARLKKVYIHNQGYQKGLDPVDIAKAYDFTASTPEVEKLQSWKEALVHEFGHALGLVHEFHYFKAAGINEDKIPEAVLPCITRGLSDIKNKDEAASAVAIGTFDRYSVMNYYWGSCNTKEGRGSYLLSIGDIAVVRYLYGRNPLTQSDLNDISVTSLDVIQMEPLDLYGRYTKPQLEYVAILNARNPRWDEKEVAEPVVTTPPVVPPASNQPFMDGINSIYEIDEQNTKTYIKVYMPKTYLVGNSRVISVLHWYTGADRALYNNVTFVRHYMPSSISGEYFLVEDVYPWERSTAPVSLGTLGPILLRPWVKTPKHDWVEFFFADGTTRVHTITSGPTVNTTIILLPSAEKRKQMANISNIAALLLVQ